MFGSGTVRSGLATFLLMAVPVFAADPITVPTSTDRTLPVTAGTGFDWSGFYAGVYAGAQTPAEAGDTAGLIGIDAGVNAAFDFYLVGAEVAVQGVPGDSGETVYGQILGRAGLVIADDALLYGAGGYGLDLEDPDEQDVLAGAGLELALTDSVSIDARYLRSFPMDQEEADNRFTVGANLHF